MDDLNGTLIIDDRDVAKLLAMELVSHFTDFGVFYYHGRMQWEFRFSLSDAAKVGEALVAALNATIGA